MNSPFDGGWEELQKKIIGLGDSSLRKSHYASYRNSHEIIEAIFQASPVPIITLDKDSIVTAWNFAAERLFGWTAEEALGRPLPILPPERMGEHRELMDVCYEGEVFSNVEIQRVTKDGTVLDVALSGAPLRDSTGQIVGVIAVYVDFTERKRLEAQLLQADRLASVGRLAGGIAHDFNNLLTVINGYSDLVLHQLQRGTDAFEKISLIRRAGQNGSELTKQLLAFSRKQKLDARIIDLNSVVADLQEMLARLIGDDIRLVATCTQEAATIKTDPVLIQQVIMNLAANARDAMRGGGVLTIGTSIVSSSSVEVGPPTGECVELIVSDTGCGMEEHVREHIFEPFFTTKEVGEGTGLGLAMVWGIVTQSGGSITVESEVGRGTTFRLLFPRATGAPAQPAVMVEFHASRFPFPAKILVVDDQAGIRQLMAEVLKRKGHEVTEADSPATALKLCSQRAVAFDLLISDMVMPGMSGLELSRRLQSIWPSLKALLISGYTSETIFPNGEMDQLTEYLEKPFTPEQLVRRIGEILAA